MSFPSGTTVEFAQKQSELLTQLERLTIEIEIAIWPVVGRLDQLDVPYYVGGSVASSFHGAARSTMDIDVITERNQKSVEALLTPLSKNDYIRQTAAVADTILAKLEWYQLGNESSDRHWDDLTRLIMANSNSIDRNYLASSASELQVSNLLDRLLTE